MFGNIKTTMESLNRILDSTIAFQDKLQLSKTYLVSNAAVKDTKPQYIQIAGDIQ